MGNAALGQHLAKSGKCPAAFAFRQKVRVVKSENGGSGKIHPRQKIARRIGLHGVMWKAQTQQCLRRVCGFRHNVREFAAKRVPAAFR